ncbi:MAG: hypothetical protein A2289_25850 [Deltaproteobacteria bacterium RIFOXYA12_FULL_58_15]|nr:MAG: hypothetical protein A2289_25850 [Deltaproteobacteria bacterium RIFOXYA12_FULL_58_15]OGR11451.1 MAG: hypothetical protein A2341_28285 [Deltaproteobacteria bacterium RIFOXYB12_FULL_58_9]
MNFETIKGRVRDKWSEFRARSIYFQLKALILASYGAVVAITLLWAPPSTLAKNQIGAGIMALEGDDIVGRSFIVENQSRNHWSNVRFEIDGGYTVELDMVQAGDKVTLYAKDFTKKVIRKRRGREIPKTVSAPVDAVITNLQIECSEGLAVEPVVNQPQ